MGEACTQAIPEEIEKDPFRLVSYILWVWTGGKFGEGIKMSAKKYWMFITCILLTGLLLVAVTLLPTGSAAAQDPGTPVSGDGVVPTEYDGNISCQYLGYTFGFKVEGNGAVAYTGAFPFDLSNGGTHTGGAPNDPFNSVTLSSSDGYYLTWASTLGIDAVIVKGGQDSNAYVYIPEDNADTGLASPDLAGGQRPQISHVEFCYDYELTATKTAATSYTRTYTWGIAKSVSPASHVGFAGDTFNSDYDVDVTRNATDKDFVVSGDIIVNNPTPFTVNFSVSDSVGGVAATVSCPSYSLAPGASITCTYTADLGDVKPANGMNTATISSSTAGVLGTTATKAYAFGDPTTIEGYPTVNVTDSVQGGLGSASGTKKFPYIDDFACPTDASLYANGVYTDQVPNRATITETGQYADANVTVTCYLWGVDKTANGTYNDQYKWNITKTVDPASQSGFAGDDLGWTWSITWSKAFDKEINHAVTGTIMVTNPAPMPLTVDVTDHLTGNLAASVICNDMDGGNSLTVNANSSGTCGYTAVPGSKLAENTATAKCGTVSVSKTVPVNWVKGADVGLDATISDSGTLSIPVDAPQPFEYSESHPCAIDPGTYNAKTLSYGLEIDNTATITWTGGSDSSTATTAFTCYLWDVSKTADGTYQNKYKWDITKTVDPAFQSGFAGETLSWTWTINWVSSFVQEINHAVTGLITVTNPAPMPLTVKVTDYLTGNFAAVVDCGGGSTSLTVAANSSATCTYTAAPGSQLAQNTALATRNDVAVSDTVDVNWSKTGDVGLDAVISDSNHAIIPADAAQPYTYTELHTCADFTEEKYGPDLTYEGGTSNTALITWTGGNDSSTANTAYTCYAPSITKTAFGTYDEKHDWVVEKTVDPLSQSGYPGDVLNWKWSVKVTETVTEEDFDAYGVITVNNPSIDEALVITLNDALNDGKLGTIIADKDCAYVGGVLTVPATGTAFCLYTADNLGYTNDADAAKFNKAWFTLFGQTYEATADIHWSKTLYDPNAILTDALKPLNEALTGHTEAGTYEFGPYTYPGSHTCDSSRAAYFVKGVYTPITDTLVNTAYVKDGDQEFDRDDATTTWTCNASFVDIYKTTNGAPADPTKDIQFALYSGTTKLSTVSTLNNGANLQFPTALVPGDKYTICESPVPAGYTFEISVNGGNMLTYAGPPGTALPTGEVQCFDFTAEAGGTTLTYNIENRYPGGAPRTPGYWKNWNRCTGGKQAETADKLNNYLGPVNGAGVFLLDDLLPQMLGSYLTIDTCQEGVYILGGQDLSGKNMSSDGAYVMSRALLAARLNQDAGACMPSVSQTWAYKGQNLTFEQILTAADNLLTRIGFKGTGSYLDPKVKGSLLTTRTDALYLYGIIDGYNNAQFCTGDPSH